MDLQPARVQQQELDLEPEQEPETARDRSRLMVAMDVINQRYGKGTLHVGSTGQTAPQRAWGMKQERRTPQYTTRLEDVPVVRA